MALAEVPVTEHVFEYMMVAARETLPRGVREHAQVDVWEDVMGSLTTQLRSYVLADHLLTESAEVVLEVETPKTAWDHVKQDWLPTFTRIFGWKVKKSYHRRKETVTFKSMHAFPEATIAYPLDFGKPIKIQMMEREKREIDA